VAQGRFKQRSKDVRLADVRCLAEGDTLASVAKRFGVTLTCVFNWKKRWVVEGTISPRKSQGRPRKLSPDQEQLLLDTLDEAPSATNTELLAFSGLRITEQSVSNYLLRNGISRKRVSDEPTNWPDERVQTEIKLFQADIANVPPEKRVYNGRVLRVYERGSSLWSCNTRKARPTTP
jgi:transposase